MVGQRKLYMYIAIGIAGLGFLLSMIGGGGILSLLGGLFAGAGAVASIALMKFGYVVMPLITKQTKTSVYLEEPYEIPPSQDVIVKKSGNEYLASSFLSIKIYESSTEKSLEQNIAYNEYFERAISNMKYVTKISYLVYVEDISAKRKDLETKRAEAQLRLAREKEKPDPDVLKIDRYEREVAKYDNEINKMVRGEKPMGVIAYAMTTAKGISKEAAIAEAKAQAKELRTLLANSLNVEVELLTADSMLKCFEWEMFFPSSREGIEDSVV
ncbi:hypothetical protein JXB01_02900 [Candidatus Micrarchaeota archaeon]|nr:hypothetical protein [Candidatus Micrarchaeota archaeon]